MAIKKVIDIDVKVTESKIKVKDLKKELDGLDGRTLKYKETLQKLRLEEQKLSNFRKTGLLKTNTQLEASNNKLSTSTNKVKDASGLAQTAVQELGRGVSDSAFGIRGMANNASQLGSLFTMLITRTGGVTLALKAMWTAMMGPLGILVAFQAITAFIQTDYFKALIAGGKKQKELNDLNKKANEIGGDNLTMFKLLTGVLLDVNASKEDQAKAVKKLNKQFEDFNTDLVTNAKNYKEARKQVDLYTKQIISQAKAEASLELIKKKQAKILELEEERAKKIRDEQKGYADRLEFINKKFKNNIALREQRKKLVKDDSEDFKDLNKKEIEELEKSIDRLSKLGDIRSLILKGGDDDDDKENKDAEKILSMRKKFRQKLEDLEDSEQINAIIRQRDRDLAVLDALGAKEEEKLEVITYYADLIDSLQKSKERERLENIKDIQDEFKRKTEEDNATSHVEKLELQKKRQLEELDLLKASKEEKADVIKYFDDKITEAKIKSEKERAEEELKIQRNLQKAKASVYSSGLDLIQALAGKSKAIANSILLIQKGLAISEVVISASKSIHKATTNLAETPAVIGVAPNPAYIKQAVATAKGIATTKLSAASAITSILAQTVGSLSSGGLGGQTAPQGQTAPSFNLVQGTGANQITQAVNQDNQQPVKAIVVSSEVTTEQQYNRNKQRQASI